MATGSVKFYPVGDLNYDADVDLVNMILQARDHPEDVLAQTALQTFYISRLLQYWTLTKEYLFDPKIRSPTSLGITTNLFERGNFEVNIEEARSQLEEHEIAFLKKINSMQARFAETREFSEESLAAVYSTFLFIAQIGCFYIDIKMDSEMPPEMWPLPNLIGLFGLNTFMYAFLNDIDLVGVPVKASVFDMKTGCPHQFMVHDRLHNTGIQRKLMRRGVLTKNGQIIMDRLRYIYTRIGADDSITNLQRQCIILYMWLDIHEFSTFDFYIADIPHVNLNTDIMGQDVLEYLNSEIKRFSEFTDDEHGESASDFARSKCQNI